MILEEYLQIKIGSKYYNHYKKLGYDKIEIGETVNIKNEDVLDGSQVKEDRICDICNNKYTKKHCSHINTYNRYKKDVCPNCVKTNEEIIKITKQRRKDTLMKHYNVDNPSKSQEISNKKKNTFLEKYGETNPMKIDAFKEKAAKTNLQKYGFTAPAKSEEVKNKAKQTCLNKYGTEYTSQVPEFRQKANDTFYKHGTQKVSSQQYEIFNILKNNGYNVELNFPLSTLSLDILLIDDGIKIDIEYDGSYWHQDDKLDRRRDEFVKSQGYKVLRIKSDKKVPNLQQLQDNISFLLTSEYNFHSFSI